VERGSAFVDERDPSVERLVRRPAGPLPRQDREAAFACGEGSFPVALAAHLPMMDRSGDPDEGRKSLLAERRAGISSAGR
jgi:hypothetical protein